MDVRFRLSSPTLRRTIVGLSVLLLACVQATAQDGGLASPQGRPILTIEGKIGVMNEDGRALFDRAMLEGIGTTSFETTTPWFSGPVTFEGVPLEQLMTLVAASGEEVVAIALNDYRTTIPIKDFHEHGVILALKRNGEYMAVSDKGPLFIVYPYDSDPKLGSQKYYARSVWQLSRLIVR
jgi:hypothetical protein